MELVSMYLTAYYLYDTLTTGGGLLLGLVRQVGGGILSGAKVRFGGTLSITTA